MHRMIMMNNGSEVVNVPTLLQSYVVVSVISEKVAITVNIKIYECNDEGEYNEHISEVVQWCKAHNLLLNAAKTK